MQEKPLVSVCIPTYNRREKLKKALDSVVNQTYKNVEIIIADNHSEDETEELCKEYAAKDPRIKYFRHDENLGMTANANFVIKQTSGEYWIGLCDDDWIDLDYIEKCINFAHIHPEYTLIMPLAKIYDEDYSLIRNTKGHKLNQNSIYNRIKMFLKIYGPCACFGLCKMDVMKQMLDCDDVIMKHRLFEDWVFTIKLLVAGNAAFIDTTYFNKLMGGWTKDFETTGELWDVNDLSVNNFWDKLKETILDAIFNDNFFELYLDEKSKTKLVKTIKKAILIEKLRKNFNYLKKNPFFMFTKSFWIRMRKRLNFSGKY